MAAGQREDERARYLRELTPLGLDASHVVVGVRGIMAQRNFIVKWVLERFHSGMRAPMVMASPQVTRFISGLALERWLPLFDDVDGPTLAQLGNEDLKEMDEEVPNMLSRTLAIDEAGGRLLQALEVCR